MSYRKLSFSILFLLFVICRIDAQQYQDPEYIKVTNERATKIVVKLALSDAAKEKAVTEIVGQQFRNLTKIQDERDAEIAKVKASGLAKETQTIEMDKLKAKAAELISKLHIQYLANLATQLNEDKIAEVKDGMTYGVLPLTYAGYLDMLPNLTKVQKEYIYSNLVEARELAMDGGSSKEKHAWFGKYKGRINNYLSREGGYDLNKESKDWQQRVEERKKNAPKK